MSGLDIVVPLDRRARMEWIKYQLRLRGSSLAQIARDLGVDRANGHHALIKPYPRVQRAIADCIGLQPHQLWPEWYHEDGTRKRKQPGPSERDNKDNSRRGTNNVRRRTAA